MLRLVFLLAMWLPLCSLFNNAFAAPQRIVSTAPSITEILFALGLGDQVAGVTRFCRFPPQALTKPKIGDYINPNLEAIAALRPDLVIIQTNPVRMAERLHALHLKTLEVNQESIEAVYSSINEIARETSVPERGVKLAGEIRARLDAIYQRSRRQTPARVMFVVGRAPKRLDGLIVAGKASYLSDLISLTGGQNIFADALAAYPEVSLEAVLARNPDVIVDFGDMGDATASQDATLWMRSPATKILKAVREHHVYTVASDVFVIPGPRVVEAAQSLFNMLHAERAP